MLCVAAAVADENAAKAAWLAKQADKGDWSRPGPAPVSAEGIIVPSVDAAEIAPIAAATSSALAAVRTKNVKSATFAKMGDYMADNGLLRVM